MNFLSMLHLDFSCLLKSLRKSQTTLYRVRLKIVEEPKKPLILDAEGSAVMGTIGPFR